MSERKDSYSNLMAESAAKVEMCPMFKDKCKGSACMGWRWAEDIPGSEQPSRGYCGIAGYVDVENKS